MDRFALSRYLRTAAQDACGSLFDSLAADLFKTHQQAWRFLDRLRPKLVLLLREELIAAGKLRGNEPDQV
jgi:hypothetical protein